MKIYRQNAEIADVYAKDSSYTNEEINGVHTAYIEFDSLNPVELTINDWIEYMGNKYYIRYQSSIEKAEDSRGYHYKVTLYHDLYRMHDIVLFMYDQPDFDKHHNRFIGTVQQVMNLVIKSMNRVSEGWSLGTVIESEPFNFDLADKTCAEVINDIINQFNTEYWVEGRVINVGKREYSQNDLILSQGGGFRSITLEAVDNTPPITRLWAYGSDTNLSKKEYGSDYLLLPSGKKSLEKNIDKYGVIEHIMQFPDIFPKGIFTVSQKLDNNTLVASDIDFNIKNQTLQDVEVIVTFQDGGLAGYDFAINPDKSDFNQRKIYINSNDEENDLDVPGDINFSVGDKFILTGLKMPQSYITKAEQELEEAAQKWLDEKCENRIQLRCTCDEIEFAERDIFIACGQLIGVYDQKLGLDRAIRCVATKRYIEEEFATPYRYEITLSDFLQGNGLSQIIEEIKDIPNQIEQAVNPVKQFTKRTWRDVQETKENMFDPEGDYFTELIRPLVVETAQLIVGTNSQQMTFEGVHFIPNYNNNPNSFRNTAGYLHHFTINGNDTTRTWSISAGTFNFSSAYQYVYAKCSRNKYSSTGYIIITTSKIIVDSDSNYYHFLVGGLNTAQDGVRSWQPSFGYTEITGNQITTGVIKDSMARMIIDLVNATIYGKIKFASGTEGYDNIKDRPDLTELKNTIITQSDKTSEKFMKDGREDIAKKLGYDNYAAMVERALSGETIINGAHIRTSIIDTETLFTEYLLASYIEALTIKTSRLTVTDGAKIGNFDISNGWLKSKMDPGNDSCFEISSSNTKIQLGRSLIDPTTGMDRMITAWIENRNADFNYLDVVGLYIRTAGNEDVGRHAIAAEMDGGLRVKGGVSLIEKCCKLNEWFPTPASNANLLKYYTTFVFQQTSNITRTLPSTSAISYTFKSFRDGRDVSNSSLIRIKILCTRYATANLDIYGSSGAQLLDSNGETISYIRMNKGDFLELGFHNGAWYTLNRSY